MEHIQCFLEKCCVKDKREKIIGPFLCQKYKEFLQKNYPNVKTEFTSNLFTMNAKKEIEKANIPGDQSISIKYTRNGKGTVYDGLTLNDTYKGEIELYNEQERVKKNNYNAKHYGIKSSKEKETGRCDFLRVTFKSEFLKRMCKNPEEAQNTKTYNKLIRCGLILKVFDDDSGTINWEETIKRTKEQIDKYEKNKKEKARTNKNCKTNDLYDYKLKNIEFRSDEPKITFNSNNLINTFNSSVSIKKTTSTDKTKLNIRKYKEDNVSNIILKKFMNYADYIRQPFPYISETCTLEEFDLFRYENYVKPREYFNEIQRNIDYTLPNYNNKIDEIYEFYNALMNKWNSFIGSPYIFDAFNDILYFRDEKIDFSKDNDWNKILLKTNYEELKQELKQKLNSN